MLSPFPSGSDLIWATALKILTGPALKIGLLGDSLALFINAKDFPDSPFSCKNSTLSWPNSISPGSLCVYAFTTKVFSTPGGAISIRLSEVQRFVVLKS